MKNLRLIITLALSLAFAATSFGADKEKKGGKGQNPVVAKLGLDKDQTKAFMAAQKDANEARKGLKDIEDKKERAAKMKEINGSLDKKLKEILSEEQFKQFQKHRAEAAKARQGKGGEAKGEGKGKKKKAE